MLLLQYVSYVVVYYTVFKKENFILDMIMLRRALDSCERRDLLENADVQ